MENVVVVREGGKVLGQGGSRFYNEKSFFRVFFVFGWSLLPNLQCFRAILGLRRVVGIETASRAGALNSHEQSVHWRQPLPYLSIKNRKNGFSMMGSIMKPSQKTKKSWIFYCIFDPKNRRK